MSLKLNERYPNRFNNPSSEYPLGSFKNRTAPNAKDGSYLEQDWANDKEGFFQSLLSAAGVTANGAVDAVGASQFFDALQVLKQLQSGTAFTTAGSAGALTLTPTPSISAYSAPLRLRVKFSQNSTGTDTINVSGKGAKSIKQYDSTGAKVAAVFAANQLADVEYDGTDLVILDQLPIDVTSFAPINSPFFTGTPGTNSTPPLHDNSARLANTNFVYQELQSYLIAASETARGLVFLATSEEVSAGTESTKAVTPLRLQGKINNALMMTAGYNRTYSDVTGSRVGGTTYTNSNNFPILVVVSIATQPGVDTTTVTVGSTIVYTGDLGTSGATAPVSFLVGNGQTYKVGLTGGATISKWVEMI